MDILRQAFLRARDDYASQLLEGESSAHWQKARAMADEALSLTSFERGWSEALKSALKTDALAQQLATRDARLQEILNEVSAMEKRQAALQGLLNERDQQVDELGERLAATEPKPAQRFTCIGKGGNYELLGSAFGAGTMKQYRCLMIYQNDSGTLFARDHDDFWGRMQEIDPVPAGFEVVEPVDERAAFEAWHASRWPDGVPFEGRWESWQARARLSGAKS
jgi:hypothetical protein